LRSRKKPPTTPLNTRGTTNKRRSRWHLPALLRPAVALLLLPVALDNVIQADDGVVQAAAYVADQVDSGVEQVSYTVSDSGHRYKWMPYQPKQAKRNTEPLRAEAAQFTAGVPPQTSDPAAPHPINDPFGDQAAPQPILPSVQDLLADDTNKKLPADDLLRPPTLESAPAPKDPPGLPSMESVESGDSLDLPTTEEYLADQRQKRTQECKSPDDILYSIEELDHTTGIRDTSIADPENRPRTCDLAGGDFVPRQWAPTTFMWQASGLCHKPAYFEDIHLERYGHSWGPYVQPLMSGAHFFLNVPVLPYKMGLYPPNECIYTLGYYRPGSCAPYMLDPLPLSVRAGLAQAGAVVGMAYLLP
jgi:hypothetical protein